MGLRRIGAAAAARAAAGGVVEDDAALADEAEVEDLAGRPAPSSIHPTAHCTTAVKLLPSTSIDVDAVSGIGFGFVVGLATGLTIVVWVWKLKRSDGRDVRWATSHLLLLPTLWLGGTGTGWAGSTVLRVLQLRPFLSWYFLTAVAVTSLLVCPVLTRFIMAIGLEIGRSTRRAPNAIRRSTPTAKPPRRPTDG